MKLLNPFFKINKYKNNITSQYGEDGIIEFLINTSKKDIHPNCVEFGAHDGTKNSNTYNLWRNKGFKCILIEGDKIRFSSLKHKFKKYNNIIPIHEYVSINGEKSLEVILNKCDFFPSTQLGVLSIDIDSFDYHILKNLSIEPQLIIIEFNNSIPGNIDYNDPENDLFLRCSAKAIQNIGFEKGYYTVCCTVTNCILIRHDCFDNNFHPNLPVEYLLDHDGMNSSNDHLFSVIHSQLVTAKPVFTKPPNKLDQIYFNISRFLMSKFGLRSEKFIGPSDNVKKAMRQANLYT